MKQLLHLGLVLLSIVSLHLNAQSLDRPIIWASDADRDSMLNRIEQYDWAATVMTKAKSVVDSKVNAHISNPASILATIPAFAADDNLSEADASSANGGHAKVTLYASYSAMLYYLTQEEKYAQFSADIVSYYIDAMVDVPVDKMAASGAYFYDTRTTYGHFAIAYDFIYDFLNKAGTQVYVESTGQKVAFDNTKAQRMIEKLASNALQEHSGADKHGKTVSNHPILSAPGTLFCIMAVDDDTERERLFNVFWEVGTSHQNSFKNTILPMFGDQGIWPESLSYSFMPGVTMVLNTIDRYKPEMNVVKDYKYILEGNFLFDYLRMPSRYFVRYGDSKRKSDQTATLYRYALDIATRHGYEDIEAKAKVALRQSYNASGGYTPSVSTSTFNAFSAFPHLFWGVPVPDQVEGSIDFDKPTVIIKHAGLALQRNHVDVNNKKYGLCGIIGGAHYVHSHVTGITMELYGQGYAMGPGGGLPGSLAERNIPIHTDYFRLYAGNNTVIVNGTSRGLQPGSWKNDAYVWMNTTTNIAAEPKHLQDPLSKNFSFATQFLDDNVNNCDQQRTLSTIRTSPTTAYYFDMFRSKSNGTNKYHDYVYHNIGDEVHIMDTEDGIVDVSPTTKYQSYYNDPVKSPGWRFFEDTEHTDTTDQAINIRFDLNDFGKYMHLLTPAGVDRQYTKAKGPASREAEGDYIDKKTPLVAIRQAGEAWNKPFVHIYEPSSSATSSVIEVEHLYQGEIIVGARVLSEIDTKTVEDYIFCLPTAASEVNLPDQGIYFKGRFAVVRYEQDVAAAQTTLYIGEGDSLTYGSFTLSGGDVRKGLKVEEGAPSYASQLLFRNVSNNEIFPKGTDLSVEALVGEDYVEVTLWANDTVNLGTKSQGPFVWSGHDILSDLQDEFYKLTLEAKDAQGNRMTKTIMIATPGQFPYTEGEVPHSIPGKIQFEYYDGGGENLGYFDMSEPSTPTYSYRDTDKVDLGLFGKVVSSIKKGEWLEYTVNVNQTGYYALTIRHSTTTYPGVDAFTLTLPNEGDTLMSVCNTLYTGYGVYYDDVVGHVFLKAGKRVLRFAMLGGGIDLDYMDLSYHSPAYRLNVEVPNGQVSISPAKEYYAKGDEITITATADEGYSFKSWSGDNATMDNPLTITFEESNINLLAQFEAASALKKNEIASLEVYPNPSEGEINISLDQGQSANYNLYSLDGVLLTSGHFVSETQVQLNHLESGVYLLEVNSPKGSEVQRLLLR